MSRRKKGPFSFIFCLEIFVLSLSLSLSVGMERKRRTSNDCAAVTARQGGEGPSIYLNSTVVFPLPFLIHNVLQGKERTHTHTHTTQ